MCIFMCQHQNLKKYNISKQPQFCWISTSLFLIFFPLRSSIHWLVIRFSRLGPFPGYLILTEVFLPLSRSNRRYNRGTLFRSSGLSKSCWSKRDCSCWWRWCYCRTRCTWRWTKSKFPPWSSLVCRFSLCSSSGHGYRKWLIHRSWCWTGLWWQLYLGNIFWKSCNGFSNSISIRWTSWQAQCKICWSSSFPLLLKGFGSDIGGDFKFSSFVHHTNSMMKNHKEFIKSIL